MSDSRFLLLATTSSLIDAAILALVLFVPRRGTGPHSPPLDLRRLLQAIVAAGAAFVLKLPFLAALGLHSFGVMTLAGIHLFITLPIAGLSVLLVAVLAYQPNPGPRVSRPVCILAAAALAFVPIGAYASLYEPFNLRLETATVPLAASRQGPAPVRIGVLADLQTARVSDYEFAAVDKLMQQQPDLVLLPGDLFQGSDAAFERNLPALRDLLGRIQAPGGAYFVLGNCDREDEIRRVCQGTPVRLLLNETKRLVIGDRVVTLGGVELECDSPDARRTIATLESGPGESDLRILLAHYPDVVSQLRPHSRIDLVVAGHTHGGQVVVPFFGPPITFSRLPRDVAAGGLHDLAGNLLYVSRGIGCERGQAPRLRFLCPPEVTLLSVGEHGVAGK